MVAITAARVSAYYLASKARKRSIAEDKRQLEAAGITTAS